MPNHKKHMEASRGIAPQPTKFQSDVHSFMDRTSKTHGNRHRDDREHSMGGVAEKFGTRALPTFFSHITEDYLDKLKKKRRF
jgi:hypothetical protein